MVVCFFPMYLRSFRLVTQVGLTVWLHVVCCSLLSVTLYCDGFLSSLLSCFVFMCFLQCIQGYNFCLLVFTTGRAGFELVLFYLGLFWGG